MRQRSYLLVFDGMSDFFDVILFISFVCISITGRVKCVIILIRRQMSHFSFVYLAIASL